jgi:iron(III) transport system permease protein
LELIGTGLPADRVGWYRRRLPIDGWTVGALAVAALLAIPLVSVVFLAVSPSGGIWQHLASTVLGHYVQTTVVLMAGVGLGTLVIGTGTAWLVTMCRFPGRRLFEWALLVPLAVPSYVIAYVYTDLLEFAGPIQILLRDITGWTSHNDYWFPEIRSLGGAISMMTLVLYPYVYLLARAAFMEQSVCVLEVSRTLGAGPWRSFFRVALPLARPAVVAGVSLVMMETLNDYGTVDFFAVATFTTGIYDVWLNMGSAAGAAQLASVLLLFVVTLIVIERQARKGQRFHHTTNRYRVLPRVKLNRSAAAVAVAACLAPIILGFGIPALVLGRYAMANFEKSATEQFWQLAANSLGLSAATAALAVAVGLFLAYALRLRRNPALRIIAGFAGTGYAVPGAVLAVGVVIPLAGFDNALDAAMTAAFGVSTGLLFSGTVVAVMFGYLVRFLALSFGTVEASLGKVTDSMDGAARTLGQTPLAVLRKIHLPIIRGSLLTAAILVFVDCMKELPMTMLLRPFNFDTLATHVHQLASDELLEESALGAFAIVAVGILPVIALSRTISHSRPGQKQAEGGRS